MKLLALPAAALLAALLFPPAAAPAQQPAGAAQPSAPDGGGRRSVLSLTLLPPVPGIAGTTNCVTVTGATPGARVLLCGACFRGSTPLPGCASAFVDLRNPVEPGSARADFTGTAVICGPVSSKFSGRTVYLQAVELSTCSVSNLVSFRFL